MPGSGAGQAAPVIAGYVSEQHEGEAGHGSVG